MLMVPASLILAGSLATRAGSTAGALDDVVADAELELPSDSESEPQAVRASAVVAAAATTRARVRNIGVLSGGGDGTRGCPGTVYGADPATAAGHARHTLVTISLCDDAHPRATPARSERLRRTPLGPAPFSAPAPSLVGPAARPVPEEPPPWP